MAKVLIIDDNEMNVKLLKDVLEAGGTAVETAEDGQAGLDKAYGNDYDLILLDLQMPVVNGFDFLKAYDKKTPVIVVSACAMEEDIRQAKELGCVEFIAKPIKIAEFLGTIKNYLR